MQQVSYVHVESMKSRISGKTTAEMNDQKLGKSDISPFYLHRNIIIVPVSQKQKV